MAFRVALTFDAEHADRPPSRRTGPSASSTGSRPRASAATFFIQGRWAEAEPARRPPDRRRGPPRRQPHPSPCAHDGLDPTGRAADLRAAEARSGAVTGVDPRPWFRCPFGDGMDDPAVLAGLDRLGYRSVGWDVDSLDWQAHATGPAVARRIVEGAVERGDGAVVLQHPWTRGDLVVASQPAIEGLRAAGATFVRVDELPGWSA